MLFNLTPTLGSSHAIRPMRGLYVPGDAEEIIGKARTGSLPIFKNQPGFVAYGVMVRGNQLISMSAWKSEGDAKAADELAREWVSENVDMTVVNSFVGDYEWLEFAQQ